MLIKKLIQRLLDSRTTAAEAAHSAMPKPETPTIVSDPVTDKTWHSLIAPFDGYFSCKGITRHMLIENSAAQWSGVTGLTSGGYMGVTLPMSKGSEVRYQLDHNTTGVMVTFSKTIGGYLRSIVSAVCKRGQLCLSRLSLYLPRSSWLVRRSGLATKLKLSYQAARIFPTLRARILRIILRQMMVLCVSTLRMQVGLGWYRQAIRLEEFCSILPTLEEFTNSSYFRLLRERLLASTSLLTKLPLESSSFRPLALNVVNGGASC